jgi:hypothetical protein
LKEVKRKLLADKKKLLLTLEQLLHMHEQLEHVNAILDEKKSIVLAKMENNNSFKQVKSDRGLNHEIFLIVTWGPSKLDGLVFTVMAESEVWAKELVRQWLNSNGRENHRIDKVQSLVSRDVRAIVNVGKKLLDV